MAEDAALRRRGRVRVHFLIIALFLPGGFGGAGSSGLAGHNQKPSGVAAASKRMPDGKQWTVENLDLAVDPSFCYDGREENCRRYGRLYTWESAQRACRALGAGWRLPTNDDWARMAKPYGGVRDEAADGGKAAFAALVTGGRSGFDAVYGGGRDTAGEYARVEAQGFYWTASESSPTTGWFYNLGKNGQILNRHDTGEKQGAFAARCVRE
jgi:uncharacterized protein (TIGR02145 family)